MPAPMPSRSGQRKRRLHAEGQVLQPGASASPALPTIEGQSTRQKGGHAKEICSFPAQRSRPIRESAARNGGSQPSHFEPSATRLQDSKGASLRAQKAG